MNIAIMMCGHMRTYKENYENFYNAHIEPNKEYNIDLFIVTSDVNSARHNLSPVIEPTSELKNDKKYFEGHGIIYNVDESELTNEIKKQFNDEYYKLAGVYFVDEKIEDNNIDPMSWEWFRRGIFSKPYHAMQIVKEYQKENNIKYDVVVRLRPDITPLKQIAIQKPEQNTINVFGGPLSTFQPWQSPDQFENGIYIFDSYAHGDLEIMEKYVSIHKRYESYETIVNKHPYNSENQLYLHLRNNNIKINYVINHRHGYGQCYGDE